MPLSPNPVSRELVHQRKIQCDGYLRSDGLWDIEARMTDTKTYDMDNRHRGGQIKAGEPLHDMWLRLTIDSDFLIHDVEAVIDYAPYDICPGIVDAFKALKGRKIAAGFTRLNKELFGGTSGCTHLRELLGPIATTAFQATHKVRKAKTRQPGTRPVTLNTCHAMSDSGPVVKEFYPDFYRRPESETEN